MPINYGLAENLKVKSIAVKVLQNKYEYSIAYTHEGYWESNRIDYLVLSYKSGSYYKETIHLDRSKNGKWSAAETSSDEIDAEKAKNFVTYLDSSEFWHLNPDSLNNQEIKTEDGKIKTQTIFDATNYRFELIKPDSVVMLDTYAPEYFLTEYQRDMGRKLFIKIRDTFIATLKEQ